MAQNTTMNLIIKMEKISKTTLTKSRMDHKKRVMLTKGLRYIKAMMTKRFQRDSQRIKIRPTRNKRTRLRSRMMSKRRIMVLHSSMNTMPSQQPILKQWNSMWVMMAKYRGSMPMGRKKSFSIMELRESPSRMATQSSTSTTRTSSRPTLMARLCTTSQRQRQPRQPSLTVCKSLNFRTIRSKSTSQTKLRK